MASQEWKFFESGLRIHTIHYIARYAKIENKD